MKILLSLNTRINYIYFLVLLNLFSFILIGVAPVDIIKYFGYLFFYIYLPGLLMTELITEETELPEKLFYAFPVGLFAEHLLHIVFYTLGIPELLIYTLPVLSIYAIYFFKVKKSYSFQISLDPKTETTFSVFLLLLGGISWISLYLPVGHPGVDNYFMLYQDSVWTLGNIASSLYSLIPEDLRLAGFPRYYHLSQTWHLANILYVTNINPVDLLIRLEHFTIFVYLLISLFFIANKYLTTHIYKIFFIISFFFFNPLHIAHILYNPLSYFYSMIYFLPLIYWLHEWFTTNRIKNPLIFLILLIGTIGAKGSLYPVLAICFFLVLLINYRSLKVTKQIVLVGIASFCVFLLWYINIYSLANARIELRLILPENNTIEAYYVLIKSLGTILLYTLKSHLDFFWQIPIILFTLYHLYKNKKIENIAIFSLLFVFVNLFLTSIFNFVGGSPYFSMYPIVILSLSAIYLAEKYGYIFNNKFLNIFLILVFITGLSSILKSIYDWNVTPWGIKNLFIPDNELSKLRKTLSAEEYQGLQYLKEHTSFDSVILSDRQHIFNNNGILVSRFFYYSTFSNRKFLVEGREFLGARNADFTKMLNDRQKDIYFIYRSSDFNKINSVIQKNGINYIIVSKRFTPKFPFAESPYIKSVYSNKDIEIYKTHMKSNHDKGYK